MPPVSLLKLARTCQNWELFGRKVQGAERSHFHALKPPNHHKKSTPSRRPTHGIPSTIPRLPSTVRPPRSPHRHHSVAQGSGSMVRHRGREHPPSTPALAGASHMRGSDCDQSRRKVRVAASPRSRTHTRNTHTLGMPTHALTCSSLVVDVFLPNPSRCRAAPCWGTSGRWAVSEK